MLFFICIKRNTKKETSRVLFTMKYGCSHGSRSVLLDRPSNIILCTAKVMFLNLRKLYLYNIIFIIKRQIMIIVCLCVVHFC